MFDFTTYNSHVPNESIFSHTLLSLSNLSQSVVVAKTSRFSSTPRFWTVNLSPWPLFTVGKYVNRVPCSSAADICDQTQGPESRPQRDREFRLRGPGQPAAVGVLDARRVPSAHVPRQRLRTLSRDARRHAAHTGRPKRRRRFPGVLCAVCRRIGDLEGVLTSESRAFRRLFWRTVLARKRRGAVRFKRPTYCTPSESTRWRF